MTAAEGTRRHPRHEPREQSIRTAPWRPLLRAARAPFRLLNRLLHRTPALPEATREEEVVLMRLEVLKGRGRTLVYLMQSCVAQLDLLLGVEPLERPLPQPSPLPAARMNRVRRRRYPRAGPVAARRSIPLALVALMLTPLLAIAAIYAVVEFYDSYVNDLVPPELTAINVPYQGSRIYDRNGNLLYEFVDEENGTRLPVDLEDVADTFLAATIATEDRSFFDNPGVNLRGLARAAWENFSPLSNVEVLSGSGGSSITQQLVKNVYVPQEERQERSIDRKLLEATYALELTQRYPKPQILEWYVNQISYGGLYNGVEAAARGYFGKPASELTLAEAAMLAGIPQSPALYDPRNNPTDALARRNQILDILGELGEVKIGEDRVFAVTPQQISAAKQEPLTVLPNVYEIEAPHFVLNHVVPQLEALFGREALLRDGLEITTSLDLGVQAKAQTALDQWIVEFEDISGSRNGAMLVIDAPTGEILGYIGSRDYYREDIDGNVNNLTALNSPGSSFKPFVYLSTFLKLNWSPSTLIDDSPITYTESDGSTFSPQNPSRNSYLGPTTIRNSLGNSLNVTAFKAALAVGVNSIIEVANTMGFTTLHGQYGPAISIGGVDLTAIDLAYGYSVLANNGRMVGSDAILPHAEGERTIDPIAILRVEDSHGIVLYDVDDHRRSEQVVPAEAAYMVTSILSDPTSQCVTFGCGGITIPGHVAGVKTGTSEPFDPDGPDAGKIGETWAFGYTPDYVVGVWAGNSDNTPIVNIYSTSISFRAMRDTLLAVYDGRPSSAFPLPENLEERRVCSPRSGCRSDLFVKGSPRTTQEAQPTATPTAGRIQATGPEPQPVALITSPTGQVSGTVLLQGWAWAPSLASYRLEFGAGANPSSWQVIGEWGSNVQGGSLGSWVTTGLPPGPYTLRVVVTDRDLGVTVSPGMTLTVAP